MRGTAAILVGTQGLEVDMGGGKVVSDCAGGFRGSAAGLMPTAGRVVGTGRPGDVGGVDGVSGVDGVGGVYGVGGLGVGGGARGVSRALAEAPRARPGLRRAGSSPARVLAVALAAAVGAVVGVGFGAGGPAMAYEENYPATPVGVVEVKTLPPARVIEADGAGGSVSGQDGAFMVLFRYIDRNNLSMTVPVESAARPAAKMRFFVERKVKEPLPEAPGVAVYERPAQTVLALGMRGGYTEARFREGVDTLTRWLADHPEWKASGEPYAVYWNGPFVPWFLKKSEVHLPVASVPPVPSAPPVPLVAPAGSAPGAE